MLRCESTKQSLYQDLLYHFEAGSRTTLSHSARPRIGPINACNENCYALISDDGTHLITKWIDDVLLR
jgi:hypothetical protein